MADRPLSTLPVIVSLLVLLAIAGCGMRESASPASPYPGASPVAALPTAYPAPGVQPTQTAQPYGPTVIVEYAANVFGIVIDAELRIVHVEPGGGADLGGLRAGDQLRSIAGVELRAGDPATLQQARAVVAANQPSPPEPGIPVPFVVERDGATLTLQVAPAQVGLRITPGQIPATATPVWPPYDYF